MATSVVMGLQMSVSVSSYLYLVLIQHVVVASTFTDADRVEGVEV